MSANNDETRSPTGASTDPRWRPEEGGLPMVGLPAVAWPSPTATGPIGTGGTITPPVVTSGDIREFMPHPSDGRLSDAEAALMAARRNTVNALEWIERALRDLRKARQP